MVGCTISGHVGLGYIAKVAQQEPGSKPASSRSSGLCFRSFFGFLP